MVKPIPFGVAVKLMAVVVQLKIVVPELLIIDAVGGVFTVMVAAAFVNPVVRLHPFASVTDVNV
jgi:hypothetical protein